MPFCMNCGKQLPDEANFCSGCGSTVDTTNFNNNDQRQQEWAGEVIKCPECGEVLKSFEINCPACGHELRNIKTSNAVKEFALKLEAIEAGREYEKPRGLFSSQEALQRVSKTDEQKISLIKSFSVPNSKEDMLEFMILATSNMNMTTYDYYSNTSISKGEKELNAAWYSKVQQVYEKAKRSYSTDNVFIEIKSLYDKCNENIKKSQKRGVIKWILMFGWVPLVYIILVPFLIITNSEQEKQELERLDNIVVEVQTALGNEEYKHALRIADSIDYQRSDVEMERKWDIQRQYWVEKVLEEAAEKGIQLEYTPSEDIDNANDNDEEVTTHEGFIGGLEEGLQPGLEEMEKNIDEFNSIINGEDLDITEKYVENEPNLNTEVVETDTVTLQSTETVQSTNVDITISIEKGTQYTYGHDEWDLYCATAISDSIIKIEKWSKKLSSEKSFDYEYEVGSFKITDSSNEFCWIDNEHTAFTFNLQDKHSWDFKKPKEITFSILETNNDTNKGTNINSDTIFYSYQNDDWHLYRAVLLTESIIKIECWYRSFAVGDFNYGYDVGVINLEDTTTDFEWIDDKHISFALSLQDEQNGELKETTFVTFTLHN